MNRNPRLPDIPKGKKFNYGEKVKYSIDSISWIDIYLKYEINSQSLFIFKSKTDKYPKDVIILSNVIEYIIEQNFVFKLILPQNAFEFQTKSNGSLNIWINIISKIIRKKSVVLKAAKLPQIRHINLFSRDPVNDIESLLIITRKDSPVYQHSIGISKSFPNLLNGQRIHK